jgi:DNA-binding NarL/FixJ family response regulator
MIRGMEGPKRVLLADDEELFLESAAQLFRRAGYACDCARDAAETLSAIEGSGYDVIVSDINMAGNRELELVREIRDRFADVPVILVTGHPSVATAIEALRLSAVDYILKPVNFTELLQRVEEAIAAQRARRVVERHLEEFGPAVEKLQSIHQSLAGVGGERVAAETLAASRVAGRGAGRADEGADGGDGPRNGFDLSTVTDLLSPREREILEAVAGGQRVQAIARTFSISPYTVRNHLKAIFRKLGVHSQVELLAQLHGRSRQSDRGHGSA